MTSVERSRGRWLRRASVRSVATLGISLLVLAIGAPFASAAQAETEDLRPSILLIVTDDQRWDTLWAMPRVQRRVVDRGTTFHEAFVVNPICCPSRASILTGGYSHTTGVYRQIPPYGRFEALRDDSTLATWLDDAGYSTGLFGKYIDGYQHPALTGYVPPGWDRWVAFVHAAYTDYKLTIDGRIETYGSTPADHSTSVLGGYAEEFIRTTTGPLFVEFAPAAPHAPATPPPGADASAFADLEPWRPPSYDESDVSDKPGYVRSLPRVDPSGSAVIDAFRIDQYRALRAVDEQVDSLLDALRDTGRLSNTLIVYTSDNGLLWGEHRWSAKEVPYEESIRVPLVVRYDPLGREARDEHRIALNIDLAPTIADVAGTTHPPTDGTSLRPLLTGGNDPWRTDFLIEHMQGVNDVPTYCAVRTTTDVLVSYGPSGEREYYDLVRDPYQLRNLAADDDHAARVDELERRLRELCDPLPPGFTTPSRFPLTLAVVAGVGAGALVVSRRRRVMRRDRAVL